MVENTEFIDRLEKAMDLLEKKWGYINVFSAFKMDDFTDRWTIVIAADWVKEGNFHQIYTDLRSYILKFLSPKEMLLIARFGIFDLENHLIDDTLKKYRVSGNDSIRVKDEPINGNHIHDGYILRSSLG